jgi:hypothetical protein
MSPELPVILLWVQAVQTEPGGTLPFADAAFDAVAGGMSVSTHMIG